MTIMQGRDGHVGRDLVTPCLNFKFFLWVEQINRDHRANRGRPMKGFV